MRLAVVVLASLGLAAGALTAWWLGATDGPPQQRPEFTLSDLNGHPRHIAEWDGKLVLINFWATWCMPCLKEIPLLIEAQETYGARGLQVLGPALDQTDAVREFVERQQINYPVLLGETEIIALMDALGDTVGGLPFTVLIDRDGNIRARHSGGLEGAAITALVESHLDQGL